ncbi:MAG: MFS transporter [Betaproteobacteria bacterium]|nr:MFS transporter [Betaproteobacteria bacterium]
MKAPSYLQRQLWVALTAILLLVTAAIATTVGLMYRTFDASIAPQVLEKASTAGRSLSGLISQAAGHGIAIEKLVGVETLFADTEKKHPEISYISLLRAGKSTASYGVSTDAAVALTARMPVAGYENEKAELAVGIDPKYVRKLFEEMALDLLVVAVVTLFVSLELLYFLAGSMVADVAALKARFAALMRGAFFPMPQSSALGQAWSRALDARAADVVQQYHDTLAALRNKIQQRHANRSESRTERFRPIRAMIAAMRDARSRFTFVESRQGRRAEATNDAALVLGAMRAPFFLLLLADDLSRSFLPMYAAGLSAGPFSSFDISPNMVASLPIFAFMLVVALSQPVLGGWSERIGRRRSVLAGAMLACFAHFLSAQASSLPELLVWRAAGGAAWAIAFVAAQGYILDHTDAKTRTAGLAAFVGIIMVSMVCGPSIGGILADGIGHRATILVGGGLTLTALALAWRRLPVDPPREVVAAAGAAPKLSLAFANRRFMLLLLLAAVPAKIILIAYCFYLIPLYITGAGSTSAMAGRLIMLYSVMMVLLVPMMANWVMGLRARHAHEPEALFVAAGLALSGIAGLAMALPLGLFSPLLVVLLLGIGQSLSISPQAAMVAEVCKDEIRTLGQSAVYGVYRMVERFGNAVGPLIAAALLEFAGFQTAFIAIGGTVLACAVLFSIIFLRPQPAVAAPMQESPQGSSD